MYIYNICVIVMRLNMYYTKRTVTAAGESEIYNTLYMGNIII